jgi:hypothetical protein
MYNSPNQVSILQEQISKLKTGSIYIFKYQREMCTNTTMVPDTIFGNYIEEIEDEMTTNINKIIESLNIDIINIECIYSYTESVWLPDEELHIKRDTIKYHIPKLNKKKIFV